MPPTTEIIKQMKRITAYKSTIFRLERKYMTARGSWVWDFERALKRERFHLKVELQTLRLMRAGIPRRIAYFRALKRENPSIRG